MGIGRPPRSSWLPSTGAKRRSKRERELLREMVSASLPTLEEGRVDNLFFPKISTGSYCLCRWVPRGHGESRTDEYRTTLILPLASRQQWAVRRMRWSWSLQPIWRQGFTALTSWCPRKAVGYDQSWVCASWTGRFISFLSRCFRRSDVESDRLIATAAVPQMSGQILGRLLSENLNMRCTCCLLILTLWSAAAGCNNHMPMCISSFSLHSKSIGPSKRDDNLSVIWRDISVPYFREWGLHM